VTATKPTTIDGYLAAIAPAARTSLEAFRTAVRAAAPEAAEEISYGIPTFKYRGRPLIYVGAWKGHCAFYGVDIEQHRDALSAFEIEKGTVRFPHGSVVPDELVAALVHGRMAEIDAKPSVRRKRAGG
jgi:uncharacterized protein YdhG (YjbR/CyaY superfamily)